MREESGEKRRQWGCGGGGSVKDERRDILFEHLGNGEMKW
jgi:hypothetical protein